MKIIFPEQNDPVARAAIATFPDITFLSADSPATAAEMLSKGQADSIITGLDYPTRDVILAFKERLPLSSEYFSSCFICTRGNEHYTLADGGINKLPEKEQLYTITKDTAITHQKFFDEQPKIALLSYSTHGSGGKNPDLEKIHYVIEKIRADHPEWLIDGELQLDAAIVPTIAEKKIPTSPLSGRANVLITPDLNSGNILYKSLARLGGFTCAGPIVQGFKMPLADLSRGSTLEDIILTIKVIKKIHGGKS